MFNLYDLQTEQKRAEERTDVVAKARQAHRVFYGDGKPPALYPPLQVVLNRIGRRLVRWGDALQRRYPATISRGECC